MVAKISQAQTDIITASFQKLTAQQAAEQSGASLATVKRVWAKLRASSPVPIPPRTPRARDYPDRIEPSQCAYQLTKDTTIAQLCKHIATSEEQMQSELRKAENCDDPYERSVRIRVADDYHKQMLDAIRLMPAKQREDSRWRWFEARMLEKNGHRAEDVSMLWEEGGFGKLFGFMC